MPGLGRAQGHVLLFLVSSLQREELNSFPDIPPTEAAQNKALQAQMSFRVSLALIWRVCTHAAAHVPGVCHELPGGKHWYPQLQHQTQVSRSIICVP